MGWKKRKKSYRAQYNAQIDRMWEELNHYQPGTPEYTAILDNIDRLQNQMLNQKNVNQRVDGKIKGTVVAGAVVGALLVGNKLLNDYGDTMSAAAQRVGNGLIDTTIRLFNPFRLG